LQKENEVHTQELKAQREQVFKEIEKRVDDLEEDKRYKDGFIEGLKSNK